MIVGKSKMGVFIVGGWGNGSLFDIEIGSDAKGGWGLISRSKIPIILLWY